MILVWLGVIVSMFAGQVKETAWTVWQNYPKVTQTFVKLKFHMYIR